jgi:hypothetical protein
LFSIAAVGLFALPPGPATAGLAVRATAVSGPAIGVSPTSYDFGRVNVGSSSATFDFTISNTGDADLHVSGLTHSNAAAGFTADAGTLPATIAPGDSRTLSSSYVPVGSGPQSDIVGVVSDASSGFFTIVLSGVANNAPVFNPALAPTYSAVAFVPFTLIATADDPEGDERSWSITGLPLGATFDGSTGTLEWPNPGPAGSHPMTISVSDGIATSSASFTVTVTADNSPPTANPGGPYNGLTGIPVSLSGSASSDPDAGQTLSFAWDLGDGSLGSGATLNHTYTAPGNYIVSLTVTDNGPPPLSHTAFTSASIRNFIAATIVRNHPEEPIRTTGNRQELFGIETNDWPLTDINPSTIKMSTTYPNAGTVPEITNTDAKALNIGDIDANGYYDLDVHFKRSAIKELLLHVPNGATVELVFTARTIIDRAPVRGTIDVVKAGASQVISAASPNPIKRDGTTISYSVRDGGPVSIRIFSAGGKLVRTLKEAEYTTAGTHEEMWDGIGDRGERVGSGIYFVRTVVLDEASVSKLVVMK